MTTPVPVTMNSTPVVPLALGAMLMGTRTPEEEARRILDHFVTTVAARYRTADGGPVKAMIDTADCYCWWESRGDAGGHSEAVLGRWLADTSLREDVYLSTKGSGLITDVNQVWGEGAEPNWEQARRSYVGASAPTLASSLEASLERLGLDSIDLYYVHVDDPTVPLAETLSALAGFVADGRIKAYGWSNVYTYRLATIRALCDQHGWPQPIALQQQHSYLRPRAGLRHRSVVSDEQLHYLEDHHDLRLVAYSPMLKGIYNSAAKRAGHWALDNYAGPDADVRLETVTRIAADLGCTGNQLVLAWLRHGSQPEVLPLMGPRTWDQYLEAVESLDVHLDAETMAELDGAGA